LGFGTDQPPGLSLSRIFQDQHKQAASQGQKQETGGCQQGYSRAARFKRFAPKSGKESIHSFPPVNRIK
jgi:hypothetical protein